MFRSSISNLLVLAFSLGCAASEPDCADGSCDSRAGASFVDALRIDEEGCEGLREAIDQVTDSCASAIDDVIAECRTAAQSLDDRCDGAISEVERELAAARGELGELQAIYDRAVAAGDRETAARAEAAIDEVHAELRSLLAEVDELERRCAAAEDDIVERCDGALDALGKVAAVTGAHVLCENAFARVDRGGTLPHLTRLPYFPKDAAAALEAYEVVVTCDARRPIAMFGYDGQGPSHLLRQTDDDVWEIDCGGDVAGNVKVLLEEVVKIVGENVADAKIAAKAAQRPPPPKMPLDAKLNPVALCAVVACSQPARCIVVDESLTSGGSYWDQSAGCPEFTHVTLTGGAIGFGPPASVGAAVACPDRWVINLQADGSAMYSTQALWTQARESLKVVTVVCANRAYQILKIEIAMQRVGPSGPVAKSLTDLTQPAIDWVSVAKGHGVPASTVNPVRELRAALEEAFARSGPTLIEANLAA